MSAQMVAYAADELLTDEARAHLVGDSETRASAHLLRRLGAIDAAGRLTGFGVALARHVLAEIEAPEWSEADSIALTAALVADGVTFRLLAGPERTAAVVALSRRGMSAAAISRRVGCSERTAMADAKAGGAPIQRPDRATGFTYADIRRVLAAPRGQGKQ